MLSESVWRTYLRPVMKRINASITTISSIKMIALAVINQGTIKAMEDFLHI